MDTSLFQIVLGYGNTNRGKLDFSLCVDDFGIKYFSPTDAQHLLHALRGGGNCNCNYVILQYIAIIELQLLIAEMIIIAIVIGAGSNNCNCNWWVFG